jgi:hypothetical protein
MAQWRADKALRSASAVPGSTPGRGGVFLVHADPRRGVLLMAAAVRAMTLEQQLGLARTVCAAVSAVCAMTTMLVVLAR